MKKFVALLAVAACLSLVAGEAWAVPSPDMEGPSSGGSSSGGSSSGKPSGGSSSGGSSSGSSAVSGSRAKYDLNDAVAAINPDGQDNTVTIGF